MSIKEYVEHVYLQHIFDGEFDAQSSGRWVPIEEMKRLFSGAMRNAFKAQGFDVKDRYDDIVTEIFGDLLTVGAIRQEGDEFTGLFYNLNYSAKDIYVKGKQNGNAVVKRMSALGPSALPAALGKICDIEGWERLQLEGSDVNFIAEIDDHKDEVPAADRYVRLDDNYATRDRLINSIDEIVEEIRGDNDAEQKWGEEKHRISTELTAGKELLKSPVARVRAVWVVLGSALSFIATKFATGLIGKLAGDLLEAIRLLLGLN